MLSFHNHKMLMSPSLSSFILLFVTDLALSKHSNSTCVGRAGHGRSGRKTAEFFARLLQDYTVY